MTHSPEERLRHIELLNQTHEFPTRVVIKVIGINEVAFLESVIEAVRAESLLDERPPHSFREARGGRHIAITLEPHLENAEQVLAVYARLQVIQGVVMLL